MRACPLIHAKIYDCMLTKDMVYEVYKPAMSVFGQEPGKEE
jgi:hypothetical protein